MVEWIIALNFRLQTFYIVEIRTGSDPARYNVLMSRSIYRVLVTTVTGNYRSTAVSIRLKRLRLQNTVQEKLIENHENSDNFLLTFQLNT